MMMMISPMSGRVGTRSHFNAVALEQLNTAYTAIGSVHITHLISFHFIEISDIRQLQSPRAIVRHCLRDRRSVVLIYNTGV